MTIINESGLHSLTLSSRLESSKKFKHWVTSEVLPSIKRTGTYGVSDIEKVVDRMLTEKIENIISEEKIKSIITKVLDKKTDYIIKTIDEHSDIRMNRITESVKESIT